MVSLWKRFLTRYVVVRSAQLFVLVIIGCLLFFVLINIHESMTNKHRIALRDRMYSQRGLIKEFLVDSGMMDDSNKVRPVSAYITNIAEYFENQREMDTKYVHIKNNYILIISATNDNDVFLLPLNLDSKNWPFVTIDYSMWYPYGSNVRDRLKEQMVFPLLLQECRSVGHGGMADSSKELGTDLGVMVQGDCASSEGGRAQREE